jgi:hypothetical protein
MGLALANDPNSRVIVKIINFINVSLLLLIVFYEMFLSRTVILLFFNKSFKSNSIDSITATGHTLVPHVKISIQKPLCSGHVCMLRWLSANKKIAVTPPPGKL